MKKDTVNNVKMLSKKEEKQPLENKDGIAQVVIRVGQ